MAIDRSILGILERSKKAWNFDVVLNGQKNRKMSAKTAQGRENPPRGGDRVSDFVGSWPQGGHARDKKMAIGLWEMDNGQKEMENGKWKMASDKKQVASKRVMVSEMI